MRTLNDVHWQFASFFEEERLRPYAYLLSKRMQEGHICIHPADVRIFKHEIPFEFEFEPGLLFRIPQYVSTRPDRISPFILHKDRLYLQRYFSYETQILESIQELMQAEIDMQNERREQLSNLKPFIQKLQATIDNTGLPINEKPDWQLIAALQAVLHNFSIITGGPGTGKTTTVAKILAILYTLQPNLRVALAAPTGKAAVRMAESLKLTSLNLPHEITEKFQSLAPSTIHRLLKYIPGSVYFRYNSENPIPYDVIIVDEASMIDVPLFAKLLKAVPKSSRIIFLGDKNQLASVEAGSMLGDLCRTLSATNILSTYSSSFINNFIADPSRQIPPAFIGNTNAFLSEHIIELQRSHRFNSIGGIGQLSKAIIRNDQLALESIFNAASGTEVIIDQAYSETVFDEFVKGYEEYIREPDVQKALIKINKLRVLVAVREGERGLSTINRKIELTLRKRGLLQTDDEFYENRPIIVTQNNKDLQLFNGDVGIIRRDKDNTLRAWFEDSNKKIRSVMPAYISHAETVFAMTIHKSQGSEYDEVLVLLPDNTENKLLTRELLYTAVTRAKSKVIIQGTKNIILSTAQAEVKRASGIQERFEQMTKS